MIDERMAETRRGKSLFIVRKRGGVPSRAETRNARHLSKLWVLPVPSQFTVVCASCSMSRMEGREWDDEPV